MPHTSDTRILGYEPLLSPAALLEELPLGPAEAAMVERSRSEVRAVLDGEDDRLLVVAGPCSVHDPAAGLDYARQLAALREELGEDLLVVMRVYFEKPRTVTGWKGLINDPGMDSTHDVHRGLRLARRFLLDVVSLGLPVGCEWLDPITPQYIADAVAWGAIGARTTESQVHRQLASGLSMPIGFKNGTDGDVRVAVDACRAAAAGHTFFGVTRAGAAAVVTTAGNPDCHVILRGGRPGPNYEPGPVRTALEMISGAGLARRVMVDASHGNSGTTGASPRWPGCWQARSAAVSRASWASCWKASCSPGARSPGTRRRWCTGRASPTRASTWMPPPRCCTGWPPRSGSAGPACPRGPAPGAPPRPRPDGRGLLMGERPDGRAS